MTPKYRAEIDARPDSDNKSGLGVTGMVRPPMEGQLVTIAVQPVGGEKFYVHTKTGAGGSPNGS